MVLHGKLPDDANNRTRNQTNEAVEEGQVNAVTNEEQMQDQLNVNQAEPIASVQRKELQ